MSEEEKEFKTDGKARTYEWNDISTEKYRSYVFAKDNAVVAIVRIDNPLRLNVSKSGGHRVFDLKGISHYIPPGWVHLFWEVHDDEPNFVF